MFPFHGPDTWIISDSWHFHLVVLCLHLKLLAPLFLLLRQFGVPCHEPRWTPQLWKCLAFLVNRFLLVGNKKNAVCPISLFALAARKLKFSLP